jgi:hypothetical protein
MITTAVSSDLVILVALKLTIILAIEKRQDKVIMTVLKYDYVIDAGYAQKSEGESECESHCHSDH